MDATSIVLASVLGVAIMAIIAVAACMAWALKAMSEAMTGLTHKFADQSMAFSDADLEKMRIHVEFLKKGEFPPDTSPRIVVPQGPPNDYVSTVMPDSPIN